MLHIEKGHEPRELTEYKQKKGAYYDGCPKDAIRQALLVEQGYLCAYCMSRIDKQAMKIEHWVAQSHLTETEAMDYRNMLGVCSGVWAGQYTCDTKRQNKLLSVNPLQQTSVQAIAYQEQTGEIYSKNKGIHNDLNETLNLNLPLLKINRKNALNACKKVLIAKQKSGIWSRAFLEKQVDRYRQPNKSGKKQPYAGIMIWYLEKKLAQ